MEVKKKKKYLFYRILGSIDNLIAILLLFSMLIFFAAMGFSPRLLLPVFMGLCMLLYTNLAAVFARYVMVKGNFLRYRLKDWIKVNAVVTLLFAGIVTGILTWRLIDQDMLHQVSTSTQVPEQFLKASMLTLMGCMGLLAIHVIMTFRYLRQFHHHFKDQDPPPAA
jgi:hypothetical protein